MDSMDIPCTSTVIAAAFILLTVVYFWIKNRGLPPGPKGLPYLGLYPYLNDENVLLNLEEYKKEYGDMFCFTYTGRTYINLGSIKAMREIQLQKSDCFTARTNDCSILAELLKHGLFSVNGEPWKVLRKYFIQKFKEYGLNTVRDDLAAPLYDSLNSAVEHLKNVHEHPVNIVDFLAQYCAITMRKILFGENGVTDEEISKMVIAFSGTLEGNVGVNLLLIGPLAKFFFLTKARFRKTMKNEKIMKQVILNCVKRIESSVKDNEPTCIVEEFYKEKSERRKKNDPSWKYFTDDALVDSLFQFVGDGIASVSAFMAGILNALHEYPDEQEKLYSEIMEVVGSNRQPTAEDRPNLPYTNAFLTECVRTTEFLIFFTSLECTKKTTVRGHKIPVGSITILNFFSAHHDPETFENPEIFNPSRYLTSTDKPKAESPVIFGMGKRICTGEPFVMLQSFLFLTTIVKNFKVVASNAENDKSGNFLVDGKLELTFEPRKEM